MNEDIKKVLETLTENGLDYRHYTEDRLIEMDLGGQDQLYQVMQLITNNLEYWCYDLCIGLDIKISFDFERVSIQY